MDQDPVLLELAAAYAEVEAAATLTKAAAQRANAAVLAAVDAGYKAGQMAAIVGVDRTTIQHRIKRAAP